MVYEMRETLRCKRSVPRPKAWLSASTIKS